MSTYNDDDDRPQHISEQIAISKRQLSSFSNFYSRIPEFLFKSSSVQNSMLDEIYEHNSQLEALLREIIELELNEDTFRKVPITESHRPCQCSLCINESKKDHENDERYDEVDDEEEDDD